MLELSFVVGVTEEKVLDGGGTNGCVGGGHEEGVMGLDLSGCWKPRAGESAPDDGIPGLAEPVRYSKAAWTAMLDGLNGPVELKDALREWLAEAGIWPKNCW